MAVMASAGCAAFGEALNPYKSDFNCPLTDKGKCVDMKSAYNESLQQNNSVNTLTTEGQIVGVSGETLYQNARNRKLSEMLKDPTTPIVAPPRVMRVLLLPYKSDSNDLFMPRYAYFFVDQPQWVFGNYMTNMTEED